MGKFFTCSSVSTGSEHPFAVVLWLQFLSLSTYDLLLYVLSNSAYVSFPLPYIIFLQCWVPNLGPWACSEATEWHPSTSSSCKGIVTMFRPSWIVQHGHFLRPLAQFNFSPKACCLNKIIFTHSAEWSYFGGLPLASFRCYRRASPVTFSPIALLKEGFLF